MGLYYRVLEEMLPLQLHHQLLLLLPLLLLKLQSKFDLNADIKLSFVPNWFKHVLIHLLGFCLCRVPKKKSKK